MDPPRDFPQGFQRLQEPFRDESQFAFQFLLMT